MLEFMLVAMTNDHLDEVAQIEQICFSTPWSRDALKAQLCNEWARFMVAVESNHRLVIGYAGLHYVCDEGYITNIVVLPKFRLCGVARALLADIINFGCENGLRFISLEVRISNVPAISLYESLGFVVAGRRKGFYSLPQEDALIMTKYLTTTT